MNAAESSVFSTSCEVRAAPGRIFGLIADPSRQPDWDSNDNRADAAPGQRVRTVGDVFTMTLIFGPRSRQR